MKKILIKRCSECPNIGYGPVFAEVAFIPRCEKANQEIKYKEVEQRPAKKIRMIVAVPDEEIPDWCPLDDAE